MIHLFKDPNQFTAKQFCDALRAIHPTDHQRKMLQVHYSALNHTLTASQMSEALGYAREHYTANILYGGFASKLAKELHFDCGENPEVFILSTFNEKPPWIWIMRPPLVKALEELGWVEEKEALMPVVEVESPPERITATVSRILRDTDVARSLRLATTIVAKSAKFKFKQRLTVTTSRFTTFDHSAAVTMAWTSTRIC